MMRVSSVLFLIVALLLVASVPSMHHGEAAPALSSGCTALNSAFFDGLYSARIVMNVFDFTANEVITIQAGPPDTGPPTTFGLWFDGAVVVSAPYSAGRLVYTVPADVAGINEIGVRVDLGTSATFSVSCDYVPPPAIAPGCDVFVPIPSTAVSGMFVADAAIYWAPGKLTSPLVTIPAGNTFLVAGQDETGQFRKVLLACQWLWVEAYTVGPNPQAPWNGMPLPTAVVE
jgi:hypothetical protein